MKLKALSHYDNDMDTRYGDCILLFDASSLVVYDCGHIKHEEFIESFLKTNPVITSVYIVVSHNDSDHTAGVCVLLDWLAARNKYTVKVYTHQYLKHVDTILDRIDDGRRNRESLKEALLAEFDHIREIIEAAEKYDFFSEEALIDTKIGSCTIVGPTEDEFIDVAAKAVDARESDTIGEGNAQESVMNAASVQMKCPFDNGKCILLCGDASPDYLKNLASYDTIQLPHHGQADDAKAIFDELGDDSYYKDFLISDNTGSAQNSGGSDDLVKYMKKENYSTAYNTHNGVVDLPKFSATIYTQPHRRTILGDLDSIKGCR